ncbi:MAG: LacI family DNA-binding transcriptional regulator [Halopseudomonas aestusnigri]
MNTNGRATLIDVARKAKVSTATVSRCLSHPDKVAEKTRLSIEAVIDEIGYTPHFGGRALASNRTGMVGAIIPTMENAIFATAIQSFQETLAKSEISLQVGSSGYDPEKELFQVKSLIAHGADGLLLTGAERLQKTTKVLEQAQIPYVTAWNSKNDISKYSVGFDNRLAAFSLTQSVLDFGHRNIAIISGFLENNDRAIDRVLGIKDAIEKHHNKGLITDIVETKYSIKAGEEAFDKLMSNTITPTAIICGNDVLATGATIRAKMRNIDVPGDISITGFDDIDLATVVSPALTTVRVPQVGMGEASAVMLMKLISGGANIKSMIRRVEFKTEIMIRESLGSVPNIMYHTSRNYF